MKSFFAALRSLVLPYGATSGKRLVLDGVNGRIVVYDAAGTAIGLIDGSVGFKVNAANNAYIQIFNTVGGAGQAESVIIFRPGNTTGLVPDWLPDADIGQGFISAYGQSASGLLGRGTLVTEIDGVAWASGVGAPITYPVIRLETPSFDGVNQPNPVIRLIDGNNTGNVDISLNGNVGIGAVGGQVSITPGAKFGRDNGLLNFPTTLTTVSGVTLSLVPDTAVYNNFGMWNAVTPNRLTVQHAGQYEVGCVVNFAAQAVTAGLRSVFVSQNGSTVAMKNDPTTTQQNGFATTVTVTTRVQAAVGDFFTFSAFQNSGANLALNSISRGWAELIEST